MLILSLLMLLQGPAGPVPQPGWDATIARAEGVADRVFDCMDVQTKMQIKAHVADMTPELVVDQALASCQNLNAEYVAAVTGSESPISKASGQELADKFFASVRKVYLEKVDQFMVDPEFAELRVKIVVMQWRKCVVDKATSWSRLKDEAATIAQAALTACRDKKQNVVQASGYQLRSKGLSASNAGDMIDKVQITMKDIAIEAIISERAKRLPARR